MWRLSRLDIKGFKSFAEQAELVFPEGITAVVGPNGCGKSNISDAIVWALGEQSTSVLRAQSMQDVIFQGSAARKATPFAEVTLHLTGRPVQALLPALGNGNGNGNGAGPVHGGNGVADGDGEADLLGDLEGPHYEETPRPEEDDDEAQELRITRRLYRSGESEYLMDGDKCLLRDIREKLLGTGLGFRACFTIEQGRIDQILSASPVERRLPIEEAAGISLYRRRRHRTNLKLEATAQDLSRIDDICQEVSRQMRSLKRQAGRARRYRELRDELRGLERRWFSLRLLQTESATEVAKAALQAMSLGETVARETLDFAGRAWESARGAWRAKRQHQADRRQELYNAQVEHERARNEASRLRDRAAFADDRVEEVRRKVEEIAARREDAREVLEARRAAAAETEENARTAERIHQEAVERLDPLLHLEEEARGDQTESRERTLEILPLAARVDVVEAHRRAVALVLGNRLRQPVLGDDEIDPWLDAVAERRGVTRGLRAAAGDLAPQGPAADADGVVGPLTGSVTGRDDVSAAVLADLLREVWLVDTRERALELAAAHPGAGFVDVAGSVWARGSEIVLRNEVAQSDEITESSRRSLRLKVAEEGPTPERRPALPSEELESARVHVERAEGARRAARSQAAAAQREVQGAEVGLRQADAEKERLEREIRTLRETAGKALEQAADSDRRAAAAAERCQVLEDELAQEEGVDVAEEAQTAGLEAAVAAARNALERVQARRSSAEVHAAEVRVERQHLHGQVRDRLDMEPRELLEQVRRQDAEVDAAGEEGAAAPEPVAPLELQRSIRAVREAIDRLGPVNLVAYEDFKEQEARFQDLDAQRQDLLTAASNLKEAIRKIDEECVKRFADAFEAIDGYFNRIFRQLFGGGRAGMRLENPDEPLTSGIEIVAQPPGKTLQSIRLMSGGERSMIALALMFAIFEYHPAPFCILDEADAALDDRNVGRFARALHHFQDRAQFIMITHNKRSMEVADLLYGVTMEESGISKLVSVQLN